MHKAWCKMVVTTDNNQNDKKIFTANFTKTQPVEKEVQIVLDKILDKITKELSINVTALEKRRGTVERNSYGNSFKMRVINACKRKRLTYQDIAIQFGINKSLISKWKKTREKDM